MKRISAFRWLTGVTVALTLLAAWEFPAVLDTAGILAYPVWKTRLVFLQTGLYAIAFILLGLAVSPLAPWLSERIQKLADWIRPGRGLVFPVIGLILILLVYLSMGPYYTYQAGKAVQGWLVWLTGLAIGLLLTAGWPKRGLSFWLAAGLLGAGFGLLAGSLFSQVTNYPFSQTWSEGMLMVNAAQFAGPKIWGQPVDWPVMNRTHALLQSLSFFLPGNQPLWLHRFWNSTLWLMMPILLMMTLSRRLPNFSRGEKVLFILWGCLFLNQGPIYFNLILVPLIVLWGFRPRKFWRSMAVVLAASVWAGLSRINWYPMPAAVALLLYIFETPYPGRFWRYIWRPLAWGVSGIGVAFATNQIYLLLAESTLNHTFTSLKSPLLWYRLFPSATFPLGILPALLLVCSGLLLLISWKIFLRGELHPWRKTIIALVLGVFLIGGLVVSVKIGGGNNLHNLDSFLVLLLITAGYTFAVQIKMDGEWAPSQKLPLWLPGLILCLPLIFQMPFTPYRPPVDQKTIVRVEKRLEELVRASMEAGKPVLFVSNSQMLAIQRFPGILPEPHYEVVFMMEMAMAGNQAYFTEFYERLKRQEWGLIVIDTLSLATAGQEKSFGEEQTAWVKWVAEPLRKYYIPIGGSLQAMLILAEPR